MVFTSQEIFIFTNSFVLSFRYELETGAADWDDAEKQVQRAVQAKDGDGDLTVSVRAENTRKGKRKAETAEEVYHEEMGELEGKRGRKGKKGRG